MGVANPNSAPPGGRRAYLPPKVDARHQALQDNARNKRTYVPPRRGRATTVFDWPLRNPIERIETQQARHTARANLEMQHAQRGSIERDYGPAFAVHAIPHLTNAEVVHALTSPPGRDVSHQAYAEFPAKKSGGGFNLTPAAIVHLPIGALQDLGQELVGHGKAEAVLTRLGQDAEKGWETVPGVGHFLGRAARDAYSIPATALPSLYLPIREAVRGQVAGVEGNPVAANKHLANAQHMVVDPIVHTLEHPLQSLSQHPVQTALIFRGVEGGLSRGAGASARSGLLGKGAKGFANTERVPLALAGNALENRHYSNGLVEQAAQRHADKRALGKGRGTVVRQPVVQHVPIDSSYTGAATWHSAHGDHTVDVTGVAGHHEGRAYMNVAGSHTAVPVDELTAPLHGHEPVGAIKATPRQLVGFDVSKVPVLPFAGKLHRRVDLEYGKGVDIGRQRRDIALHLLGSKRPKHGEDAVALVNEGVLKSPTSVERDLQEHVAQLRAEGEHLTDPADKAHNEANIAAVERLLSNRKFLADPRPAFAAAEHYAALQALHDAARVHHGDFTPAAAERRILLPFAHREMPGVEYNHDLGRFERVVQVPVHIAQKVDRETAQLKESLATAKRYEAHPSRIQSLEEQLAEATFNSAQRAMQTARANRGETTTIGLPVRNQEIIDAFHAKGGSVARLAYVPQHGHLNTSSNFNVSSGFRRPGAAVGHFTGASNRAGTYDRSFDVLREQLAKAATRVARHENVTNLVTQFGIKQADGNYFDLKGAQREARAQEAATGTQYVPVTVARQSAPGGLLDELHPAVAEETFRPAEQGDSHVVLMPKAVFDRVREHEQRQIANNAAASAFARANRLFRHTVLPTSPRWFAGNAIEAWLRMQMHDLTPVQVAMTIRAGRKLEAKVRELGGDRAVENLRAAGGTGHFGMTRQLDVHINEASAFMHAAHALRDTPGPKQIVTAWTRYRDFVFDANTRMESSVYYHTLGRIARREVHETTGSMLKAMHLAGPAYADVARGLLDSNKVAEYARAVDETRGRYSNLSPSGRWATATLTPFAPWYANAVHFIAMLPVRHPVKAGILAAATQGTEKERAAYNVPSWAKSDIPLPGGGTLNLEHYTPFGVTESGGLAQNAATLVIPQFEGAILNEIGDTWYGQQLPKGTNVQVMALNTMLTTFVPGLARAQTVLERGHTAAPDSTIFHPKGKAGATGGSYLAGVRKAFDPFRAHNAAPQRTYVTPKKRGPTLGTGGSRGSGPKLGTGSTGGVKLG